MIGPGLAGATFNAYAYGFDSGLAGTLTVTIYDSNNAVVTGPVTTPIAEIDLGGQQSAYQYIGTFPPEGEYLILWQDPISGAEAAEEIFSSAVVPLTITAPTTGPCQPWIDGEDVADACDITDQGTDTQVALDTAAEIASTLLYRLTLKKFSGICTKTIRPCRAGCGCQHVEEGWYWRGHDWLRGNGTFCGCGCVAQVRLSGVVRAIVDVLIDGETVAPDTYRLDEYKYLVRIQDNGGWPRCQNLDLPSTEPGTFQITYLAGMDPPAAGAAAAKQLACQLYRGSTGGDCSLPSGVTRIIRQGLVIERVDSLAAMLRKGATGLPLVDSFMAVFNPTGAMLGPAVWSPDLPPHRKVIS
jgi:hypothetical protein